MVLLVNLGGMIMWQFWLIVSGIFFVVEIATVGFLVFWLGIGALLAMITSFFVEDIIIQSTVFVISSALLMFLTRPFVNKFTKKDTVPTNAYSVIGKHGIVTEEINPTLGKGQVKVETEIWSAKSEDDSIISVGTEIEILSIEGVKVIVKPIHIISTLQSTN